MLVQAEPDKLGLLDTTDRAWKRLPDPPLKFEEDFQEREQQAITHRSIHSVMAGDPWMRDL